MFWFNPLVWLLARESHQLREEAADDAVLLSDVDGTDYASLLVSAARHDNQALLLAAHGVAPAKDSLKRRITRVLDTSLARRPANVGWVALCLVAVLGIAGPLAALEPAAKRADQSADLAFAADAPSVSEIAARAVAGAVPDVVRRALGDESNELVEADEARESDEGDSEAERLIEMKAVGLSASYIEEMQAAGFSGPIDDLIEARAVGVTPAFAREMRRYSPDIELEAVVEARAIGLSPELVGQVRGLMPEMSIDNTAEFAALGVTPDYLRAMHGLFPRLTPGEVVEMKAIGVTPEFIERKRREGVSIREPDEAVEVLLFGQLSDDDDPDPPEPPASGRGNRNAMHGPPSPAVPRPPGPGN